MRRHRKRFTGQEKVSILRHHFLEKVAVSDLCEKHQIHPTVFYRWQAQFFEKGAAAFEKVNSGQEKRYLETIKGLEQKLQRKHEVLSELMEEHVLLKKTLGPA